MIPAEGRIEEVIPNQTCNRWRHHHWHQEDRHENVFKAVTVQDDREQNSDSNLEEHTKRTILEEQTPADPKLVVSEQFFKIFELLL